MDLTTLIPPERETDPPPAPPSMQMLRLSHLRASGDGSTQGQMVAQFAPTLGTGAEERYATKADIPALIEQHRFSWADLPAVPATPEGQEPQDTLYGSVSCPPGDPARALATASRTVMLYTPLVLPPNGHPLRTAVQAAFAVLLEAINTGLTRVSKEQQAAILATASVPSAPLSTVEGLLSSQVGVLLMPWAEKTEG